MMMMVLVLVLVLAAAAAVVMKMKMKGEDATSTAWPFATVMMSESFQWWTLVLVVRMLSTSFTVELAVMLSVRIMILIDTSIVTNNPQGAPKTRPGNSQATRSSDAA